MQYLALMDADPAHQPKSGTPACKTIIDGDTAFAAALKARGAVVAGDGLKPVETAASLRVRAGKTEMMDGPFAESKAHPALAKVMRADRGAVSGGADRAAAGFSGGAGGIAGSRCLGPGALGAVRRAGAGRDDSADAEFCGCCVPDQTARACDLKSINFKHMRPKPKKRPSFRSAKSNREV